jgi:CRISPR-associated protein Csh1
MFTTIKYLADINENKEDIASLLDYPGSTATKEARFLLFEKDNKGNITYKGLSLPEELEKDNIKSYLYPPKMYRPSNGTYKTPTIIFSKDSKGNYEPVKSFNKKIYKWFEDNKKKAPLFENIYKTMQVNKDTIEDDVTKVPINTFVSIKINSEYIGKFNQFVSLFFSEDEIIEHISTSKQDSLKDVFIKNSACIVCLEDHCANLYGFASPFSFFTVKEGKFSYDFDPQNAAKQLPICLECAKKIRGAGRDFLENELSLRLCDTDYYLIPELLDYSEEKKELLIQIIEQIKKGRKEFFKLAQVEKKLSVLNKAETKILENLSVYKNYFTLNLFFYKKGNNDFRILASIEEVLPSSLQKLFKAIKETETDLYNKEIYQNSEEDPLEFKFKTLSTILENQDVRLDKRSKKEFLEIVNNILTLRPISYEYFLKKIMDTIYSYKGKGKSTYITLFIQGKDEYKTIKRLVLESFLLLNLFQKLELFAKRENHKQMISGSEAILDHYCQEFEGILDTPLKRAIFGMGVLTEQIAHIQTQYYNDKKSKPIYKDLRNFKVDLRHLQEKVFIKLKAKLEAYNKCKNLKIPYVSLSMLCNEISENLLSGAKEKN